MSDGLTAASHNASFLQPSFTHEHRSLDGSGFEPMQVLLSSGKKNASQAKRYFQNGQGFTPMQVGFGVSSPHNQAIPT
jgi:hypothetical protein